METLVEFAIGIGLFVAAYRGLMDRWPWDHNEKEL